MTAHRTLVALLSLAFLSSGALAASKKRSAPAPRKPAKAAPAAAEAPASAAVPAAPGSLEMKALLEQIDAAGGDKKRMKAYLKRRLARLKDHQKARAEFLEKEADAAKAFSVKQYEDRETFEERMVKQTEDMFASLASLDKGDRSAAMADIQRTQASLLRLFESQQKQKTAEFFDARFKRWAEFAAKQEKERLDFLAQAPADWQRTGGKDEDKSAVASDSSQPQ